MSSPDLDSYVHVGLWTDWSHGSVLGKRLTLTRSDANLLIAFTAFFIAFVATQFWRLFCLVHHRYSSSSIPQNALYYQQQVILRNSASAEVGLLSFLRLSWSWRKLGLRCLLPLLPLCSLTILIIAAFTIAGGFSSQISSATGDTVLLDHQKCGFISPPANFSDSNPFKSLFARKISNAANYAQQCYLNNSAGLLDCNRFVVDRIPWESETNASCPFSDTICRDAQYNIRLDTGHIDTNDILGLNAPPRERSSSRYVLHCSPLVTEGYKSVTNVSDEGALVQYNYGWSSEGGRSNITARNYTYAVPDTHSQYLRGHTGANLKLTISSWITVNGETIGLSGGDSSLHLKKGIIPELARSDGDVHVIFLSGNGVVFDRPINDPWYRATVVGGTSSSAFFDGAAPYWIPEEAASPLGCVEQFQYCNLAHPDKPCGPLASFNDAVNGATALFNTTPEDFLPRQLPRGNLEATRLWRMASIWLYNPQNLRNLILKAQAQSLISQVLLYSGVQSLAEAEIPWQRDVEYWFATIQAHLQAVYIDTVIGARDALLDSWRLPLEDLEQELCDGQKIRSSRHASFHVFALVFTYVVGGVIIILSALSEPAMKYLHERYGYRSYEHLEWTTNEQLQLLRLAYEEIGLGTWTDCTQATPVTGLGETLAGLDISEPKHPIISRLPVKERPLEFNGVHDVISDITPVGDETSSNGTGDETSSNVAGNEMSSNVAGDETSSNGAGNETSSNGAGDASVEGDAPSRGMSDARSNSSSEEAGQLAVRDLGNA